MQVHFNAQSQLGLHTLFRGRQGRATDKSSYSTSIGAPKSHLRWHFGDEASLPDPLNAIRHPHIAIPIPQTSWSPREGTR